MGSGQEVRLAWYVVELTDRFLRISQRRVDNIFDSIDKVFASLPYICARDLASSDHWLAQLYLCIRLLVPCHSLDPYLSMEVAKRLRWDQIYGLASDNPRVYEMCFWKENLKQLNNRFLIDGFYVTSLFFVFLMLIQK